MKHMTALIAGVLFWGLIVVVFFPERVGQGAAAVVNSFNETLKKDVPNE